MKKLLGNQDRDFLFLAALVVLSIGVAALLVFRPGANKWFGSCKAYEITTQFVFVAMIGGLAGIAYKRWEDRKAEKKERLQIEKDIMASRRASLEEFYSCFINLHHGYKKARRSIAACSVVDEANFHIERASYEHLMESLEELQIKAEQMRREVDVKKDLFGDKHTDVSSSLVYIEEYLRRLLKDYETSFASRRLMEKNALLLLCPELQEFTSRRRGNRDKPLTTELFGPADTLRSVLVSLIEENSPR